MAGDGISNEESESTESKERRFGENFSGTLFLGFFLSCVMLFSLLGIVGLIRFVVIPLEQWANVSANSSIPFEIPIFAFLTLSFIAIILLTGYMNKGGVESVWKISMPKNRKWIFAQGLLVYTLGMLSYISSLSLQVWLKFSLEAWSNQLPGSLGDFLVGMITMPLYFVPILLTGIFGYLVATKLPMFRNP